MVETSRVTSFALFILSATCGWGQIITTVAGGGWRAFPTGGISAINAPLGTPWSPALDALGNLYVPDSYNNIVVRISPTGTMTVVAGNGNAGYSGDGGPAASASLNFPTCVAFDGAGRLYIADHNNHRIRRVSGNTITTVAGNGVAGFSGDGGLAINASLNYPVGITLDILGDLYIADQFNNRIREVSSSGIIRTIVGTGALGFSGDGGPATSAMLNNPYSVALDGAGNLFIADYGNNRVRWVYGGTIETIAGDGTAGYSGDGDLSTFASLNAPSAVAVDSLGQLYIADFFNERIRKISNLIITTVAGNGQVGFSGDGGPATNATINGIGGIALDSFGNLFIADYFNERIRLVSGGAISTIAGTGGGTRFGDGGSAAGAALLNTVDVAVDSMGNLYIADAGNNCIREVSDGIITTFAGNGRAGFSGDGGPAVNASLNFPAGIAVDAAGNVYIADARNSRVRKVSGGIITTVAGNGKAGFSGDGGSATLASLNGPLRLAIDSAGSLYIADGSNNRVRKVSGGTITTVAGNGVAGYSGDGGIATSAALNAPEGIALDAAGNLYIAELGNHRIREVSGGKITTVAGNGIAGYSGDGSFATSASLDEPAGVAVDASGNLLIADFLNNRIRRVSRGTITTIAGNGAGGFSGDGGVPLSAELFNPAGVTVDSAGNLYIADTFNYRVRGILSSLPTYQVTPQSLTFSATAGAAITGSQTIGLSSSVPGVGFTVAASAPWISVTSSGGAMPASLQVSADPSRVAAGTYQGTITISAANASPSSVKVSVSFTVQPAAPAQLSVGKQNFSFTALQGSAVQTGQLQISNAGAGSLSFTAAATTASGAGWLTVSPATGTATPSSPASLTITASPGNLMPGTYQGSISITGAGTTATVTVTLSVSAPGAVILLSQSGLRFTAVAQGSSPLPQTFGILNTGQGAMNWSAMSSTLSGGSNWLQISPASGTVTQPYLDVSTVTVSIDPTGLDTGDYYGRIQVSAAAANSPQLITVILSVLQAGTNPGPDMRPTGLIFTGVAGAAPGSQDVMVGNPKALADSFTSGTAPQVPKGFTYLPVNADVLPNQPATLRVYPDFSKLQPGEIDSGAITLLFPGQITRTVTVLVVVAPSSSTPNARGVSPHANSCSSKNLNVQWRAPLPNFTAVIGQPTTLEVQVVDDCGNQIAPANSNGAQVTATFSTKDSDLNLTHIGNGIWTGTWKPIKPGTGQATVSVSAFTPGSLGVIQSGQATLSGTLSTSTTPIVTAGGVVHAASAAGGVPIAPGGLITIYGSNLADSQGPASTLPLPMSQNGAQVLLGNLPLPILYTSTGQLNVQVPFSTPVHGQFQISVQRDNLVSLPEQLVVADANPGVFTVNQQGTGQGVIFKSDGVTLAQPGTPATANETVVIYCTGLGAVTPAVPDGAPAPASPLSHTNNTPVVTIGGQNAAVQFSGLTPGYPGLYQINAVVPSGVSGDSVPVVVTVAGQTSPPVTLAVQ